MKNFSSILLSNLELFPNKECLFIVHSNQPDISITYNELVNKSAGYARRFQNLGIQPGEVVILVLQHGIDLIYAYFGAILNGSIPSIMPFLTEKLLPERYRSDMSALISITHPAAIVTDGEFFDEIQKARVPGDSVRELILVEELSGERVPDFQTLRGITCSDDDIALLQHSSGSTGLQKGVALSHKAVINQLKSYESVLSLDTENDMIVSWLPLYHDMGLIACFLMPILRNIPLILMSPFDWVRAPHRLFDLVTKYKGTLIWLPNFAFNFCALKIRDRYLEGIDLSSLRAVINCSEPTRWDSHQMFFVRFQKCGLSEEVINTCYAMAENVFAVTQSTLNRIVTVDEIDKMVYQTEKKALLAKGTGTLRMLSAGKPIPGVEIKIFDEKANELPDRQIGQIAIKSDCMLTEYYNRPEETGNSFDGEWYLTGDLGYSVKDELFITGRMKDLIIVGGKNVYPQDIEFLAMEIPGIHPGRVVAFGLFNDKSGTEDVILIAETDEVDLEKRVTLANKIREVVTKGSAIALRKVILVEKKWLVKTSSGKIARSANREKFIENFINSDI
ncbi:AMP-binding protein [Chloroflexota bacterium]